MGPGATTTTSASTAPMGLTVGVSSCVSSSWLLWRMTQHSTTSRCSVGKELQILGFILNYLITLFHNIVMLSLILDMASSHESLGCFHSKMNKINSYIIILWKIIRISNLRILTFNSFLFPFEINTFASLAFL